MKEIFLKLNNFIRKRNYLPKYIKTPNLWMFFHFVKKKLFIKLKQGTEHELKLSNPYNFAAWFSRPLILYALHSARSSLKKSKINIIRLQKYQKILVSSVRSVSLLKKFFFSFKTEHINWNIALEVYFISKLSTLIEILHLKFILFQNWAH